MLASAWMSAVCKTAARCVFILSVEKCNPAMSELHFLCIYELCISECRGDSSRPREGRKVARPAIIAGAVS